MMIAAQPLEESRAEVTVKQLQDYEKSVNEMLKICNADLICNWDQTGSEVVKYGSKCVIVGKSNKTIKCFYKTTEPAGHISLMPVIFPDGSQFRPLFVISQKTIDDDLERYGFPDGQTGYVLSTTSGFTTTDAHLDYVKKVVIPGFILRRKMLGLPDEAKGLVIQDGLKAHVDNIVKEELEKNNILTLEFPSHSSHICQPLDLVTFSLFKREMKRNLRCPRHLTDRSKRIYKIAKSLEKCTGPLLNNSAFEAAGFIYNLSKKTDKMKFDLSKINKNTRSPQDDLTMSDLPEKQPPVKRQKLVFKKTKKEKELKPDYSVKSINGTKLILTKQ